MGGAAPARGCAPDSWRRRRPPPFRSGLCTCSDLEAGYAKGKTDLRALWLAHERFVELLAGEGVRFDAAFYSYGHPDGIVPHFSGPSLDRKPGPYNLFIAVAQLDLDLARSWMIGDRESDVACARAAGVRAILVENPHADLRSPPGVIVAKRLSDAVQHIAVAEHRCGSTPLNQAQLL